MILDKNGKLFGKISIVDIFVILIFLVGIVGIFFTKMNLDKGTLLTNDSKMLIKSTATMDKMEVRLKVKEVRDITRDAIVVGDDVLLASNNKLLGKISRVESVSSVRDVISNDGTVYSAEVPDRFDVTIVVEAEGKKKVDGYYTATNIQLLYGKQLEIKTSTIQTSPKVDGVTMTPAQK